MTPRVPLLLAIFSVSCASPARRTIASAGRFDGAYRLAALRCGVARDHTQVKADLFALSAARKSRDAREIETGHSRLTAAPAVTLTITGDSFKVATPRCAAQTTGALETRGDAATLRPLSSRACGEVAAATEPSDVTFVEDVLVETTGGRCPDGRDAQRVWLGSS